MIQALYLSSPSTSLALQYDGFVPRELLAAKGLFKRAWKK